MTTPPHAYDSTNPITSPLWRRWRMLSMVVVAVVLTACADDPDTTEDRRFANEPSTEVAPTATTAADTPVATPLPALPEPSPEALLNVTGAPAIVYTLVNGSIEVVDTSGIEPARRIVTPEDSTIVAIASSTAGDRVAALVTQSGESAGSRTDVVTYDSNGLMVDRWTDVPMGKESLATPEPESEVTARPAPSMSWEPAGNRILIVTGGSELVSIDVAGDASVIPVPPPVRHIEYAAWSPDGNQVALLARNEQESGAIWVFSPYVDGVSMRQVAPPNADAADLGSVTRFTWLPDGSGLAYILAEGSGAGVEGGQLYTINLKLGIKLLIATPGRGGPNAEILDFALSPDGRAIAYVVAVPDGERWQFHSLWVRSVQSRGIYNVPVGNPDRIDRLWWALPGLAWQQLSDEQVDILVASAGLRPEIVFTLDGDGEGTPEATPIVATPLGATSAGATPIGATPVESTPDLATPTG